MPILLCNSCGGALSEKSSSCSLCSKPIHADCAIQHDGTSVCDRCYETKSLDKPSIEVPDVIRRSYIETYRDCPYKFYLQVIEGHETPHTIYTQLGVDVHDLIDRACQNSEYYEEDMKTEFDVLFKDYDDDLFDSEEQKAMMYQRGLTCIENIYPILQSMPDPFDTETKLTFSVGDNMPKVSATSDRVDMIDGKLHISDWKTGKTITGKKISSDLQAPLYIHSIQQHYKKPVQSFTFYYLNEGKERSFYHVEQDRYVCRVRKREYEIRLSDAIKEVQSVFARIQNGNFSIPSDRRNMYYTCKMCAFLDNECAGAEIQSWRQHHA